MKATCIVGSARDNGSCARLIDALIEGLQEAGAKTVKHCVGSCDIRYCLGCKRCEETGLCVQKDDAQRIIEGMLASDIVAIAAPSYWAGVPAQLKTLFDRTTPYSDTNPKRLFMPSRPIRGVAIAVRAGQRPQENELILSSIAHYFSHLGIETVKEISLCSVNTPEDLMSEHQNTLVEVRRLGSLLAESR